ncbi:hypothetical protein [Kitasatospora sp. GAS204B]|uniref:hypothetical protein n=1 Tax=unclassified Kitasatospora TaxID=2633591 RepID=UPI002475FA3C|nr:hypothetical protein [Kitasatospora sp. GAS204B]MDH6119826.1 hypothetical protein [Kitasatospora sp. GAS204B]
MTTVITAASGVLPPAGQSGCTAVGLAALAARDCLATARLAPQSVGALINVGVYREANTFEPAMAALIQKEVGINLDYLANPGPAAFSFDLMNGACGVLNAVQVAQALLETASCDRVLVTAADVHPGGCAGDDPLYPYADLGGALLLERGTQPDRGFGRVRTWSRQGDPAVAGHLETATMGAGGRAVVTVVRDADREERLLEFTASVVADYARAEGLDLARTLVLCGRPAPDFGARLASCLNLDAAQVLASAPPGPSMEGTGEAHTAGPVLGYLQATAAGLPAGTEQLLLVTAGAGLSAACASYRPPLETGDTAL